MVREELIRGIFKENPIFVLALGLCPSIAVSTSLENGLGMGLATTFVLVGSNIIVSMSRRLIPDKVRLPCYMVIIATFVTIVQLTLRAYLPVLDKQLGIYVALIVVNCVVLGRAEAFASKNGVAKSFLDGLSMGLGFTLSLCIISAIREIAGSNKLGGLLVVPHYEPMTVFVLAPGGFFALALAMGIVNHIRLKREGK